MGVPTLAESSSSVEAAMAILSIGATATHGTGTLCTLALYAQAMVVAVATIMGATAAMSAVSIDELGDKAFAAWYGALLQFTNPAGPMHAFTLPAACESTCAPLLCKWLCLDFYQVVLTQNLVRRKTK